MHLATRRGRVRTGLALAALVVLAAAFRFWALDRVPPGYHYDEAFEGLEAWRVLTQPGYHPIFFPGNFGVEPMFIYLTAAAFRLFGQAPVVMRGVGALIGTLTVLATYGLGRELVRVESRIPPATPLLAALCLAVMRWHITFSRMGIEPILVPLFLVLLLWAFWWAMRTDRRLAWVALGVITGLAPYTYPAGRVLPILLVALVAYVWLAERPRLAGRGRGLAAAGLIALAVLVPLALTFAAQPELLLLRSSQIGVGAAAAGGGAAGASAAVASGTRGTAGFWANLLRTLGMFSFRGDGDPRNNVPGLPALDLAMGCAFYLGLAFALRRWRRPVIGSLVLALLAMLAPTILSEYAPQFRRALGATPAVALLSGSGLALILGTLPALRRRFDFATTRGARLAAGYQIGLRFALVGGVLFASGALGAQAYFVSWGQSNDLYYAYDQGLWEIGQFLAQRPAGEQLFVSPRPASDTTLAFAWRNGPEVRHFDGRHAFIFPDAAGATYVIIEHEDFRGEGVLRRLYPQAEEVKTFLDRDGRVYARAYHVPAAPGSGGPVLARAPQHPVAAAAWRGADLIGYDLNQPTFRPGEIVYLQLWWRATGPAAADWTVFTHLLGAEHLDADGKPVTIWAGQDARPGAGSASMSSWRTGDLVLDEYQIRVPLDAPAGAYTIEAGLYDLSAGGARALTVPPPGADHVVLGQVEVAR